MRTLLLAIAGCAVYAQADYTDAIPKIYASTFSALREAKTKADIERMVDAIDVPEWLGTLPNGATLTRPAAVSSLMGLLEVAPENRPIPRQQMIYLAENGWNAVAVYWVYGTAGERLVGSMARDTWVRTARGWRRIRHEKLFPDRPLMENGQSLIFAGR
jgi:hypothetical protein